MDSEFTQKLTDSEDPGEGISVQPGRGTHSGPRCAGLDESPVSARAFEKASLSPGRRSLLPDRQWAGIWPHSTSGVVPVCSEQETQLYLTVCQALPKPRVSTSYYRIRNSVAGFLGLPVLCLQILFIPSLWAVQGLSTSWGNMLEKREALTDPLRVPDHLWFGLITSSPAPPLPHPRLAPQRSTPP